MADDLVGQETLGDGVTGLMGSVGLATLCVASMLGCTGSEVSPDAWDDGNGADVAGESHLDVGTDRGTGETMNPDVLPAPASWAVSAGGSGINSGKGISVDNAGNSLVTGWYTGTATFGTSTLSAKGGWDVFVAKLSPAGKFLWTTSMGGGTDDRGYSISVDSKGNAYVAGTGAITPAAKGGAFVAKLDTSGKLLWATSAGDVVYSVAADAAGNSHVAGTFLGMAAFGSITLTAQGSGGLFVARLDTSGKYQWVTPAGGSLKKTAHSIALGPAGNSHVAGSFLGTAVFGTTTLSSTGNQDLFVTKLDQSGKVLWATSAGGTSHDTAHGISVDGVGIAHVTGNYDGSASFGTTTLTAAGYQDLFVARLDKGGKFLGAASAGGLSFDNAQAIAVDSAGSSHVTGSFDSQASFGATTFLAKGSSDVFVAWLDKGGTFTLAVSAGGKGYDSGQGIALDSAGNVYLTGAVGGPASFGSTTISAKGKSDVFVARISKGGAL